MAQTILEQVFAGVLEPLSWRKTAPATLKGTGQSISTWQFVGWPGAASAPGATLNGEALTAPVAGQIEFINPSSGLLTYVEKFFALPLAALTHHRFLLCDRIWQNGGIGVTTTTAQTISAGKGKTVVWPSRDRDGSDAGVGILVGLEVEVATTNGAANTAATISYTNSGATAGRTGIVTTPSIPATAPAGSFIPFDLQAGDKGIASVESLTLSTSLVTGTVHLVAFRILAEIDGQLQRGQAAGPVELGYPRCYDGSVPFIVVVPDAATASCAWEGQIVFSQG